MDNLTKIILIVFVVFLLLNYSCGKSKENFTKRRKICKKKCIRNIKKCFKKKFKGKCMLLDNNPKQIINKCKVPSNLSATKKKNYFHILVKYVRKEKVERKRERKLRKHKLLHQ